jgi:hypothetical protein
LALLLLDINIIQLRGLLKVGLHLLATNAQLEQEQVELELIPAAVELVLVAVELVLVELEFVQKVFEAKIIEKSKYDKMINIKYHTTFAQHL